MIWNTDEERSDLSPAAAAAGRRTEIEDLRLHIKAGREAIDGGDFTDVDEAELGVFFKELISPAGKRMASFRDLPWHVQTSEKSWQPALDK
jgi:hypothetical protein